jgi:hypothetical protein
MTTTVTVAQIITDAMPETERLMQDDGNIDYANAKLRAIALAKAALYGSEVDEPSSLELKRHLADLALRDALIPAAITWCMHKTRLADSKEGANFSYPDIVAALQDLLDRTKERILAMAPRIAQLVRDAGSSGDQAQIDISILDAGKRKAKYKLLDDPWTLAGAR